LKKRRERKHLYSKLALQALVEHIPQRNPAGSRLIKLLPRKILKHRKQYLFESVSRVFPGELILDPLSDCREKPHKCPKNHWLRHHAVLLALT
jgi:hypothetical protein